MGLFRALLLTLVLTSASGLSAQPAQVEYTTAVRLMEARQYEQAYPILERLHRQDPSNYPLFDRLVTCLVELKRYPEAVGLLERRLNRRYRDIVTAVKLGEVYHISADTAKAREIWWRALEANLSDLNAFRYVAETMANRREHTQALQVYRQARERFGSPDLFVMEVANQHIAAGDAAAGVGEFIRYAEANPQSAQVILRQILRFQDPSLNDLAILELEERQARVRPHHELLIGLLMEQNYHRRALQAAREYESVAPQGVYPIFGLSGRLRAQNQFDLAAQAYTHYTAQAGHPVRADALIELARTRLLQADHLEDRNLDTDAVIHSLVTQASQALESFAIDFPSHPRQIEAWILHAELGFDHHKSGDVAADVLKRLDRLPGSVDVTYARDYLSGRNHLLQGRHSQARVAFTRANRAVQTGERAELTRYFLAYTDFLAGDLEFARLQMKSLERLSTSVHTNDAIRLRRWLAEATAADTTGAFLARFSAALSAAARGDTATALTHLEAGLSDPVNTAMRGDWLIQAVNLLRRSEPDRALALINRHLPSLSADPRREQLLWIRGRLFDSLGRGNEASDTYLQLLEAFPTGFYSDAVRVKLLERPDPTS